MVIQRRPWSFWADLSISWSFFGQPPLAPADLGSFGFVNTFVEQRFNQFHALLPGFEVSLV